VTTYQATFDGRGEALGKPVLLMFAELVAEVAGVSGDFLIFDSEKQLAGLCLVPSYEDERLAVFGLVPGDGEGRVEVCG
jgi:hypothetical protein